MIEPRRARDDHRRADRRRRLAREPRCDHAARGVEGRPAHVGQAHLGVNAFEQMVQIAEPLSDLAHELLARRTDYPLESEEARGSMLVVGGASGSGANFNVVPGAAWFSVDRRFNPEEDLDEEVARLTTTIDEAAARIDARGQHRRPPAAAVRRHERRPSRRRRACALRRGRRGRAAALRALPRRARDALVRPARHSRLRVRRRAPRRLPRPRRVHRRGRDAPLRRGLRVVRRRSPRLKANATVAGDPTARDAAAIPLFEGQSSTPFWGVERPS